eukprot:11344162-Alexandrium_andersonii.AAC.1
MATPARERYERSLSSQHHRASGTKRGRGKTLCGGLAQFHSAEQQREKVRKARSGPQTVGQVGGWVEGWGR